MNNNKVVMAGTGIMGASLCQVYALAGMRLGAMMPLRPVSKTASTLSL